MKLIHQKINRLTYPLLFIVAITAVFFLLSLSFAKESAAFVLFAFCIIALINAFIYFILNLILGIFIKNDLVSIFSCASFSFLISGKAFRIMHWPGWYFQLSVGCFLLTFTFVSLVLLFVAKFREG